MSISEVTRKRVISDLLELKVVSTCWPTWQKSYRLIAGNPPTAQGLINHLGTNLGKVFKTTGGGGRSQAGLSGSGLAWEALVCWYLNLCLVGTRTVVIKKKDQMPEPLRDALTLSYGSSQTNTESDLVAVTFPQGKMLDAYQGNYSGVEKRRLDQILGAAMGDFEVCVIQCKTNWNENAQIPMLWDLIYQSKGFGVSGVSIGRNGHSIHSLKKFAYAFVTLPSNNATSYKQSSMPVLRVSKLSGGNYWAQAHKKGVADALNGIFARNFSSVISTPGKPWPNHLKNELKKITGAYAYFRY